MTNKRRVIIVTDGDNIARKAVETAAKQIGGRCISRSAGNPTPLTCQEIVELIKQSPKDPVVVMVDDRGKPGMGKGERIIEELSRRDDIQILGVVAVASNTQGVEGINVECSVDSNGKIVKGSVDKFGNPMNSNSIYGDTVDILNCIHVPVIIGMGDPGKMNGKDHYLLGAPVMTKALQLILDRSEG